MVELSEAAQPAGGQPPARPRRTREEVLATALQIVDDQGIDALSIRRLAAQLQVDPMAIYRNAANKSALLDGIAELVRGRIAVDPLAADWRAELVRVGEAFRQETLAHPNVVPLVVTRPIGVPLALRPVGTLRNLDRFLELLCRAGFSPQQALHAFRSYWAYLNGHVLNEIHETGADARETQLLLSLELHRRADEDFDQLREVMPELVGYDGADEFRTGLDFLISGIEAAQAP